MLDLAWELQELTELNVLRRQIIIECGSLRTKLAQSKEQRISSNLPASVEKFKKELVSFVKRIVRYKRIAATHILIVMISPEESQNHMP